MPDITPPNYSTTIGQVRLLIPDVEQLDNLNNSSTAVEYLFSDSQIQALLSLYSDNVKRAAAQAKLILATSEALINKVIRTADYTTDGAKLGAELRAQAKALQDEAANDELTDSYETFIVSPPAVKWGDTWLDA
jgi:t-SNARE complex subunit (syntaxin)